jgi:hypothetical protein
MGFRCNVDDGANLSQHAGRVMAAIGVESGRHALGPMAN